MESASLAVPSGQNTPSLTPNTNGNLSPMPSDLPNTDGLSSQPDSPLSEPQLPSAMDSPSTSVESPRESEAESEKDDLSSASASDEDAEGSADEEYDLGPSAPARSSRSASARSSSSPDPNSRKRKYSDDDMEAAMAENPELYGVRRSVRSRIVPRRVVESSDEDDDASGSDMPRVRRRRKERSAPKSSKAATPAQLTESDSDGEAFVGRRRDVLSKKQKQRRRDVLNGNAPPTTAEVRFSTRQRNTITYNEDEEGMNDDLIDEDAVQEWVVDTSPYVDKVLYHRLPEGVDWTKEDLSRSDFEYLIKWQGLSQLHSTWETWATLKTYRGFKKVQNYAVHEKTGVNLHIYYQTVKNVVADERESYLVNYELLAEKIASENTPERVIGSQVIEGETQYYVKWKGQEYDQCSWEVEDAFINESEDSQKAYQKAIDAYIERSQNIPKSTRLTQRPQFKRFTEQPDYIKFGTLRDFQLDGLNRLCLHWTGYHNIMLADEMGLGKTIQTVSFLNFLRHDRNQQGPFLVCVPLSTMAAWADTFDNWTPDVNYIVYHGNKASLEIMQQYELLKDGKPRFNVLLTTYETVNRNVNFLRTFKWQYLAVDEAHRLKNSESQLYETLLSLSFDAKLLITGTPMQNNLLELKSLMDFLMPGVIQVDPKIDLTDLEGAADQLAQLRTDISRYMIRRTKQNVMKELPPKTEKVLRVDLSDLQQEYCKNITLRNYDALNTGVQGQKVSLSNILMELKKASNHPFLFPAAEERYWHPEQSREERLRDLVVTSGKMMLLDKLLERLKREGHRVLIFSQMVMVLNILAEYLKLRGHKFQQLDGTTAAAARRAAIERYNAKDSEDFCFLLSTRAGGLGINLMTADTVILFDSDWNPHADLQAMGRAHRIGQTKPVTIYRLVSADSIEEKILEAAKNKLILEYVTIQKGGQEKELQEQATRKGVILGGEKGPSRDDMARILKFGATKLFQPSADNQKKLESLDIDAVLASAEEHNTEIPADGAEEMVNDNDDFLKAFEVTDVKIDDLGWDEIVPQDEVKRMQDEENERKTQEMIKTLAGDGPRQRKKPGDQSIEERNHRAAKKRARDAQREAAADVEESDDTEADPKRPLNESETRRLLKAYQQWGSFDEMQDKIMETAKLTKRDPALVRATIDDIVNKSKDAIATEQKRLDELEKTAPGGKSVTKKERKEVLIEFNGVKRNNATTMVERPGEMTLIRSTVEQTHDKQMFRIPEAMKPANDFTCNWGPREDGMLVVGIAKYGWGSWWEIRDDPELDMKDKCFLEEQRTANKDARKEGGEAETKARKPTQVHLNRRANYLVSVLKAKASGDLDALENHHRNIKKSMIPDGANVPGMPRRVEKPRHRAHSNVDPRHRHPSAPRDRVGTPQDRHNSHHSHKHRPDSSHRHHSDHTLKRRHEDGAHHDAHKRPRTSEMNGSPNHHRNAQSSSHKVHKEHKQKAPRDEQADKRTQELMGPVVPYLSLLTESSRDAKLDKQGRVKAIKDNTLKIGDWIAKQDEDRRERFWEYLGHRCFNGSSAKSMRDIYGKMVLQRTAVGGSATPATPAAAPVAPPPTKSATPANVPTPHKANSATPSTPVVVPVHKETSGTPMSGIVPTSETPAPSTSAHANGNGTPSVESVKKEEPTNGVKVESTTLPPTATASS